MIRLKERLPVQHCTLDDSDTVWHKPISTVDHVCDVVDVWCDDDDDVVLVDTNIGDDDDVCSTSTIYNRKTTCDQQMKWCLCCRECIDVTPLSISTMTTEATIDVLNCGASDVIVHQQQRQRQQQTTHQTDYKDRTPTVIHQMNNVIISCLLMNRRTQTPLASSSYAIRKSNRQNGNYTASAAILCLLLMLNVMTLPLAYCYQQLATTNSHLLPPNASQYMAPAGCEWRARSTSNHILGQLGGGQSTGSHHETSTNSGGGGDESSLHGHGPISTQTSTVQSPSNSQMLLTCHFRTLNGALDSGANLSLIPPERTFGLLLKCEDVLFESTLPNRSFERLHQLRELHIERCKLSELPVDVFVGLNELRQLTIRTHNTDWGDLSLRLSANVFSTVRRLEQIDLSDNGLTQLPSPMFCPLSRLQHVNISSNQIGEIAAMGFRARSTYDSLPSDCRRLDSITNLDCSYNRIKVLTDRGFGRLHRLQVLDLRHNLIVRAEETSLAGLGELSRLDLSNNQLVALPARFFQAVKTTLAELYLQNNSISVIPPGLFSGLSQVTVLDLSHNEVTSHWIGPTTFSDMSRLMSLDLGYNKLSRIDATAFRALFTLQSLSLQHNEIESLAENAFANNRNLHTLSLSGNRLTSLDAASFSGLEVLNALFLDNNRLLHVHPGSFANVTGLMELNLGQNRLDAVPSAISMLHSLRSLDLSYNRIREIGNASYRGLEQLYGLNVEGNLIGNLSRGDFLDLPSLRVLNLAHNRIASVEQGTFDNIPDLHALRLDSNGLADINGLFANLRDLLMLNISANRIALFDYALIPVGLQWLDIHQNQIENLGNYFEIEAELKLRTLDASFNRLSEIEAASLPDGIELVMLNSNTLRKIAPFTFLKKANLTRADLSDNRLTTLDLNALRLSKVPVRRPLPEFSIAGNPFLCDCNIEWLQRAAVTSSTAPVGANVQETRQYPRVVDAHLVQCRLAFGRGNSPQITSLVNARPSQFLCSYRSHCFALCHCCEFDACDCEMTCPDNCTCFYDQSWSTNIVDCGANSHTEVPGRIPMDVTDLYLDSNNIPELSPHTFIGRKNLRHLHLNSSHIRAINNRTFNGLKSLLVLNLADNELDTLYGYEFERLTDLRELYLQNNHLSTIANRTFTALRSLRILRIDHNHLVEFELWTGLAHNIHLMDLFVGGNAWSCDCRFVGRMMEWLPLRSDVIRDLPLVHCQYNDTYALPLAPVTVISEASVADIEAARTNISTACSHYAKRESVASPTTSTAQVEVPVIVLVIASTFGILLLLATLVTAILYRHELGVWLFARTGFRFGDGGKGGRRRRRDYGADDNGEKLFDAFVSYSKKDEAFVSQMLAPELEFGNTPMRLCLHYRDLPVASGFVSDAIVEAMAASRRTILVISEHFLRGEWCHYEFKSAHQEALRLRARHKLILIFVGPVAGKDLDPDIRVWLKTAGNTCLQWGEKMFWEKLRYALPEIPASATSASSANSSSSSTTSSLYGRKGLHSKSGTLPALTATSLSQSPLASRNAIDSYGHQMTSHHPLLSAPGGMGHHHTIGRHHFHQQSESHLYSPSSVHSQQSTYAYPTYHPAMHNHTVHHGPSMLNTVQSTPPPLPPSHPLHLGARHVQQSTSPPSQPPTQGQLHHHGHHHPTHHTMFQTSSNSASTTVTSLESGPQHLSNTYRPSNSSNESSLITNGSDSLTGVPFVPSATSTTAVAVHI